jgi:hypothetical protein
MVASDITHSSYSSGMMFSSGKSIYAPSPHGLLTWWGSRREYRASDSLACWVERRRHNHGRSVTPDNRSASTGYISNMSHGRSIIPRIDPPHFGMSAKVNQAEAENPVIDPPQLGTSSK